MTGCDLCRAARITPWFDDHMRNIPDHYHAHGRPRAASSERRAAAGNVGSGCVASDG